MEEQAPYIFHRPRLVKFRPKKVGLIECHDYDALYEKYVASGERRSFVNFICQEEVREILNLIILMDRGSYGNSKTRHRTRIISLLAHQCGRVFNGLFRGHSKALGVEREKLGVKVVRVPKRLHL